MAPSNGPGRSTELSPFWRHCQLEAESGLEKSRALDASINAVDSVDATLASCYVTWGRDSSTYTGELLTFDADGDLVGYLDGRQIDPNAR